MAFVYDKGYPQTLDTFIHGCAFLNTLFHGDSQLLYRCNNNLLITVFQLVYQIAHVVGLVYVNNIIVRIGLERLRCLRVEVFTVDKEDCLFNTRNVNKQISCGFVAGHGLARACCMPDIARFTLS